MKPTNDDDILVFMCQREDIQFLNYYEAHIAFYEKYSIYTTLLAFVVAEQKINPFYHLLLGIEFKSEFKK